MLFTKNLAAAYSIWAGLTVASTLPRDTPNSPPVVDVVIIGAGLAGLTAARDLKAAGRTFIIVEGRDRIGGRVDGEQLQSVAGIAELGAEYVGHSQDRVLALIDDLKLRTFPAYTKGSTLFAFNGSDANPQPIDVSATGGVPPLDDQSMLELGTAIVTLDTYASTIDVNAGAWTHPNATAWDISLDDWILANLPSKPAQDIFRFAIESVLSCEPSEVSLLYTIAYIAAAGNATTPGTLEVLVNNVGDGAQALRITGGSQQIPNNLAYSIGTNNIIFRTRVTRIQRGQDNTTNAPSYSVYSQDTVVAVGDHVVVAMAPPLAGAIEYDPPLPTARTELTKRMSMGNIVKFVTVYQKPFWRDKGLNGQVNSGSGLVRATFDSSPEDASWGQLLGYINAAEARTASNMTGDALLKQILGDLTRYFGEAAMAETVLQPWDNDEFSLGGPVAHAEPGALSVYGSALRAAVDNVHFAGTETSDYWVGYMDGAVRSGERVAKEILAAYVGK